MNTDSAIKLINAAIEYFLIVIFLLALFSLGSIRNSQAEAYNRKEVYQSTIKNQLEYGGYNTGSNLKDKTECVLGNHVIETIRKYKNSSIRVYVDKDKNGNSIYMDESAVSLNPYLFSVAYLTEIIDPDTYYHPFLIYDNDAMTNIHSSGSEITGISFFKYVP